MLLELDIRDLALIADLTFRPEPGFVALTGETGAGKSILIGALSQLSGERADTTMVRSGTEMAVLSATFAQSDKTDVILSRDILASGRTAARIDGRIVPLAQLRELGQRLIAIHGQREGQRIFDESTHRPLLDRFCSDRLVKTLDAYEAERRNWLTMTRELHTFGTDPAARARRADLLSHQIREIKDAAPQAGEEEKLQETARLQKTLSKVYGDLAQALDCLSEADGVSAMDQLGLVRERLRTAAQASKTIAGIQARVDESLALLDGIRHDLERFFAKIDMDPAKLAETEARLDVYGRLKYKYGSTIDDIQAFLRRSEDEYEQLTSAESRIRSLEQHRVKSDAELRRLAAQLHDIRAAEADRVSSRIADALRELDMQNVGFAIEVETEEAVWSQAEGGLDRVRFLIASNVGEPLMPLARIASGGEAARVLLALKSILAELDDVPVLVFDEIDAGISGRTARLVGQKLRALGRLRHVFCVTHSAPIAAAADHHYVISKAEVGGRTETSLRKTEGDERMAEIARLLSGKRNDPATLQLAGTLLEEYAGTPAIQS